MVRIETPMGELYKQYLERLARLVKEGRGSSKQANRLRDMMDELWPSLMPQEEADLRQYSAALMLPEDL